MKRETSYEAWMKQEGVPVVRGYGVTDVLGMELGNWKRMGGRGAFIQLQGMEGVTGMYVGEIPPGGSLEPERHMYDELIYILSGQGVSEVWTGDKREQRTLFEWHAGSLFAPPLNTWHKLFNASGQEPIRFLAVTSAPIMIDLTHNTDFIFNCDYVFRDRYDGRPDYFNVGKPRPIQTGWGQSWVWETNLIPDVGGALLEQSESFGAGNTAMNYEISGNVLVGHMAEWPIGKYRKAHYHAGGAILLIVKSQGYTVMWPREAGLQPYQSGHADKVVKVDWQEGSVFSPPTGWFHQHFNTGPVPARQLALRYGSHNYGVQFWDDVSGEGTGVSVHEGGTIINYEDEDPEFRRLYQQALSENGVQYQMAAA